MMWSCVKQRGDAWYQVKWGSIIVQWTNACNSPFHYTINFSKLICSASWQNWKRKTSYWWQNSENGVCVGSRWSGDMLPSPVPVWQAGVSWSSPGVQRHYQLCRRLRRGGQLPDELHRGRRQPLLPGLLQHTTGNGEDPVSNNLSVSCKTVA